MRCTTPRAPRYAGGDGEGGFAIHGAPGAAHTHQGRAARRVSGHALLACTDHELFVRIRTVCSGGGAALDRGLPVRIRIRLL
jgi:hypothetical protein